MVGHILGRCLPHPHDRLALLVHPMDGTERKVRMRVEYLLLGRCNCPPI